MAINDLVNKIIVTDEFSAAFDNFEKRVSGAESAASRFGGVMAGAAGVAGTAIAALAVAAKDAADAAEVQARADAQLAAVLQSTGEAAGLSFTELKNLAEQLQDQSNYSDQAIEGAESLLLTFTKIKETFPEATATVLDMSQALGQDLKSSSIQLGKALNDPVAGVSALFEVGVSFTEGQKQMIAAMVEAGDIAGAQRVILAELNTEFGGSAAAAREAGTGYEAASNALTDLKEAAGAELLPDMRAYNELVTQAAQGWETTVRHVGLLRAAMQEANGVTEQNLANLRGTQAAIFAITNPVEALGESFRRLQGGIERAILPGANAVAAAIVDSTVGAEQFGAALEKAAAAQDQVTEAARETARVEMSAEAAVAADLAKEWEKAREKQADLARTYTRQIEDLEYDHGQRLVRIQQDIGRAVAEASADAARAREKAASDLAEGLADIEKDLAADQLQAQRDFNRDMEQLNQDRADTERQAARDLANINQELKQDLKALKQDTNQEIADLNRELADDLADLDYEAQQDRLEIDRGFNERRLTLEQQFADKRRAIDDQFSSEFAEADPFRRKILEFNRKEALSQLDQQQQAEQQALQTQQDQAVAALEQRVVREQEVLNREAEQKRAQIQQEAADRRAALQLDAEERRAALQQRLADDQAAYEARKVELERQLAEETAQRQAAAEEALVKLQEKNAAELVQIQEQEARKVAQAQEALARENQNYEDRLAALRRSNSLEQNELSLQLQAVEEARRRSYDTQLSDAEAFMEDLRRTLSGAGGSGGNYPTYIPGQAPTTYNTVNVTNNGAPGGYAGAVQTGRTVRDALGGF